MVIQRGQIWWADLADPDGSEPGYRRPVLIVQSDSFNRSNISTVIALILSSNMALREASGNVVLSKQTSGLSKDSVANVSQLVTLDKRFLIRKVSRLASSQMQTVDEGLRQVLML
jgi:mRNA interferase MazF